MKRLENGLIEGLEYKYTNQNKIDWKKMTPKEFLYLNPTDKKKIETKYNKKYEEIDVLEAEDRDLILLLGGIRYLLDIRGYKSLITKPIVATETYAAVNCQIQWIANTEEDERIYSDNACAHLSNTRSFAQKYLIEIATNRAICRTVRGYLNISIVTKEELAESNNYTESENGEADGGTAQILLKAMVEKGRNFDDIIKKLISEGHPEAENYKNIHDIPKDIQFELINRLKKFKSK